jgi:hypothetical protein
LPTSFNPVSVGPARPQTAPPSLRDTVPETEVASTPDSVTNAAAQLSLTARALRTGPPPPPPPPPEGQIQLPENLPEALTAVSQTRNSFLVNAGSALLAQANSQPSVALSLLRD